VRRAAALNVALGLVAASAAACTPRSTLGTSGTSGTSGSTPEEGSPVSSPQAPVGPLDPALAARGRLAARIGVGARPEPPKRGVSALGLEDGRDGLVLVPAAYGPSTPAPLLVMLHGAGGNARHGIDVVKAEAERRGVIVLSLDSREATWDVIVDDFGVDVTRLDRAITVVSQRLAIDPARVAVGGFSDGASYALSIGMTNGDLFSQVLAFSPGFVLTRERHGKPRLFLSHGTADAVLPIERCSRRVARDAKRDGYEVTYLEFDGPHTVPADMTRESFRLWLGAPA